MKKCSVCREAIPEARLKAVPGTRKCCKCQAKSEGKPKVKGEWLGAIAVDGELDGDFVHQFQIGG